MLFCLVPLHNPHPPHQVKYTSTLRFNETLSVVFDERVSQAEFQYEDGTNSSVAVAKLTNARMERRRPVWGTVHQRTLVKPSLVSRFCTRGTRKPANPALNFTLIQPGPSSREMELLRPNQANQCLLLNLCRSFISAPDFTDLSFPLFSGPSTSSIHIPTA